MKCNHACTLTCDRPKSHLGDHEHRELKRFGWFELAIFFGLIMTGMRGSYWMGRDKGIFDIADGIAQHRVKIRQDMHYKTKDGREDPFHTQDFGSKLPPLPEGWHYVDEDDQ